MIITFHNKEWSKRKIHVIVDNASKICTAAENNVAYLKGQSLDRILQWGFRRADEIEMRFTNSGPPASAVEPQLCCPHIEKCREASKCLNAHTQVWVCDVCSNPNHYHYVKCGKCGKVNEDADYVG